MSFKPVGLGLLAAACVTAAAGGAFVAVRQNAAPAAAVASQPVTETEALVPPPARPSAEAPDRTASPDPGSRPEAARSAAAAPVTPKGPVRPVERTAARPTPSRDTSSSTPGSAVAEGQQPPPEPAPVSDLPAVEPERAPEAPSAPPEARFVEVVVPASAVIGLQVDRSLSSETARVEDRIEARVTRDVMADGHRAIPAGSRMLGSVVLVDRGGKMKDPARLGVRFHTLVLADGSEMPLRTEAIFRDGDSPGNESSRKIGGAAVGGAILGAILGGGKGAVVGGAAGAAGGSAAVMAGGRNAATLPAGTIVTARVAGPVTIQVAKE
jgi:hypothetical protein